MSSKSQFDPDPFVIGAFFLTAAGVVLQAVQLYQSMKSTDKPDEQSVSLPKSLSERSLDHLEDRLDSFLRSKERYMRAVDRTVQDPEKSFYERKFRVGLGPMFLHSETRYEFHTKETDIMDDVRYIASSVGGMLLDDQESEILKSIGKRMLELNDNKDPSSTINEMIERGAPIRDIIRESEKLIRQFAKALQEERQGRND